LKIVVVLLLLLLLIIIRATNDDKAVIFDVVPVRNLNAALNTVERN
jgi:hypothetical protein